MYIVLYNILSDTIDNWFLSKQLIYEYNHYYVARESYLNSWFWFFKWNFNSRYVKLN
jgi:hypothetical protein